MSIAARIAEIIRFLKISQTKFANEIGSKQATISTIIKNDRDVSSSILVSIINKYPNISAQWLLAGTGNMLNNTPDPQPSENIETLKRLVDTQQDLITSLKEQLADCRRK